MNRIFWLFIPVIAFAAPGFAQYAIITTGLPTASLNQGYSTVVQTNSSVSASSCSIVSGTLPSGLSIQVNGTGCLISGVATTGGAANFTMTVSNTQGQTTPPVSFALPVFGITTSSSSLPTGTLNTSYSFSFQASGGSQYQWSVVSGNLPPGLTISSGGILSGQLQSAGTFTFTVRVADNTVGLSDTRIFSMTVSATGGGDFRIQPALLPSGNVGQSYSATIQTTGGSGNLNQNGCLVQGSLPPGIVMGPVGASCVLAGTPQSPGTFTFQVQAVDSQNRASQVESFTIVINGSTGGSGGITITNSFVPNGTTAVPYRPNGQTFQFTASGGTGIYSWFLDGGTLPTGLTLNNDGTLTGTPTQAGTFNFTVRVASSGLLTSYQQTGSRSYSMTVTVGGLTIVEASLPSATTGQAYSFQLHASGGTGPYTWALGSTGAQGITIGQNSGLISGTTSSTGTFNLPITVTDSAGASATVNFPFTASGAFSIVTGSNSLPAGYTGSGYSTSLQANGGQAPYKWAVTSGALPPGLTLSENGSFSGIPTLNGQYTATITATDAAGRTASRIFIIQIGPPGPVQITSAILPDGTTGVAYTQGLTASGGQTPYTWAVAAGNLPPGLNLAGSVIQGTPTQGGTYTFALQATDAIGNSTAKGFTITISSAGLVLSTNQLSFSFVVGGVQPVAKQVNVTSASARSFTSTSNVSWLSVSQSSGSTPSTLTISVNPQGLSAGTYTGNVTVTPSGDAAQVISVTFTVSGNSGVTISPSSLSFTYISNGVIPAAQSLSIATTGTNLSFAASASGGGWLQVSPTNGTFPATLSVSVAPLALAPGVYTGAVTIQGAGVSQQVPVTLTVTSAQTPNLTLSVPSLTYNYVVGGPTPSPQFFTVNSGPRLSFTTSITGAPWLTVSPDTGTTPASIGAAVNPAGLNPGTYLANIVITTTGGTGNSSISLPVALIISSSGAPVITAVVNSASYATGPVAPGEIVTIGGTGLGPTTPAGLTLDSNGKVATTLGGVQVFFNSTPAPLIYVSPTQINAVVPYEVAGQLNVLVSVRYQSRTSVTYPVTTTFSAPGLFTLNASGTGGGAIVNQNGTINSPSAPARKGDIVTLYLTGEGQTTPGGLTGNVTVAVGGPQPTPRPVLPVSVFIGGQQAALSFIGEAPGIVAGVLQVNALIPSNAASGDLTVEVTVGANKSQSGVTVSVQ